MTLPANIDQQVASDAAADAQIIQAQNRETEAKIETLMAPIKVFLIDTARKLDGLSVSDEGGVSEIDPDGTVRVGEHRYPIDSLDVVWFGYALAAARDALLQN